MDFTILPPVGQISVQENRGQLRGCTRLYERLRALEWIDAGAWQSISIWYGGEQYSSIGLYADYSPPNGFGCRLITCVEPRAKRIMSISARRADGTCRWPG
jgi:hypothetical protein